MGVIVFIKSHGWCVRQDGLLQVIEPSLKELAKMKQKKKNMLERYRDDPQNFKKC